ncbi:MAG TPA: hypothetical protein PLZ43_02105 [bacterium]|nr:hypothetical protein [bacterium]
MKKLFIKIAILATVAGAVFFLYQTFAMKSVSIKDLSSMQTVVIGKDKDQGEIVRLDLIVSGSFQGAGEGEVMLMDGESLVRKKAVKDQFKFDMSGIWHSGKAKIVFIPVSGNKGYVRVKYEFVEKKK